MSWSVGKHRLLVGLVVACLVVAACPAQQYTKYYQFQNTSGIAQTGVRATTFGWELITNSYSSPWPNRSVGFAWLGFTYGTTISSADTGTVLSGGMGYLGWTTADWNCYLWDLRWASGLAVINPAALGGVPGGGGMEYDPEDGMATWTIRNDLDPEGPYYGTSIDLTNVEVGVFDGPLLWEQRQYIAAYGMGEGGSGGAGYDATYGAAGEDIIIQQPWANMVAYFGRPEGLAQALPWGEQSSFSVPVNWNQVLVLRGSVGNSGVQYIEEVTVTPELSPLMLLACSGFPLLRSLWRRRRT